MSFVQNRRPYKVVLEMQKVLFADVVSQETKPADRARIALAWDKLEERKRIMRGVGAPKAVPAKNSGHRAGPTGRLAPSKPSKPTVPEVAPVEIAPANQEQPQATSISSGSETPQEPPVTPQAG